MVDARYFCPDCGSIDLKIEQGGLEVAKGTRECECPNCGWKGPIAKTVGAATTQQFWDTKRVGDVMIRTVGIHAAGPLVQCLEFIGLLPKKLPMPKPGDSGMVDGVALSADEMKRRIDYNASAQRARDGVMQAICIAAIEAGFTEAVKANKVFAVETDTEVHQMIQAEEGDTIFGGGGGGKVVPIDKNKRKKGRRR